MNNDLISREALKKEICNDKELSHWLNDSLMLKVFKYIDNAPTIELRTDRMVNGVIIPIERPKGEWIVTAEDDHGVHRICCPFCSYEKGSNNTDTIIVTFTNFPKFCENCGAELGGGAKNG